MTNNEINTIFCAYIKHRETKAIYDILELYELNQPEAIKSRKDKHHNDQIKSE